MALGPWPPRTVALNLRRGGKQPLVPTERKIMRRILTALIAGFAIMLLTPTVAAADGLSLPVETVIRAGEGSVIELGRITVDTGLAGPLCTWSASVMNQESVHPGNNIVVRSGETELLLAGVEDAELKVTSNTGSVYLADEVVVELIMGPDEVFSGGLELTIDYTSCQEPTTTTTTPPVVEPDVSVDNSTEVTTGDSTEVTVDDSTVESVAPAGPTTIETTTTVAVEVAAPILPVTGNQGLLPLVSVGFALLAAGAMMVRSTRSPS